MTTSPNPRMTRHPHGITAVDTEYIRPGLAAAHIVEHGGRAAFVDVGTNYSRPHLLAALELLGIPRDAVDYVFLTHVHLDHAGGAGSLLQDLPNARAVLHPRGAPHMTDPTKLIAASRAVYGDATYEKLYGDLVPIPPERVLIAEDQQRISLGGRVFELVHTPGHALHHYAIVDLEYRNIFTGDTFGLSYREMDSAAGPFIVPTTTPTQFDPDQLIASIDRLSEYSPDALYLTHYSRVTGVPALARAMKEQIREFERIALSNAAAPDPQAAIRSEIRALWIDRARRHGCPQDEAGIDAILGADMNLNAQGLVAWLKRRETQKH